MSLAGRIALVAGADGAIGGAVVRAFLAAGALVAADADAGDGRVFVQAGSAASLCDAAEAALGPISHLVIAAGPAPNRPFLEIDAGSFRSAFEQELLGPVLLLQEAGRRMASRGFGRIAVFGSMSGKTGAHHSTATSAAAKGGLFALVRVAATELAPRGVTVNAIATSLFEPQVASMPEARRDALRAAIPVGRFGRVEEAAAAAVWLASDVTGYVTGEVLNLSGGRYMD